MLSVLLTANAKRFFVSHIEDLFLLFLKKFKLELLKSIGLKNLEFLGDGFSPNSGFTRILRTPEEPLQEVLYKI